MEINDHDIVDLLTIYSSSYDGNVSLPSELVIGAANEIKRLREALRQIAFDYVELSYDKAERQRNVHMLIALRAYQKSFPPITDGKKPPPLNDDF